jgi:hypothetical protein
VLISSHASCQVLMWCYCGGGLWRTAMLGSADAHMPCMALLKHLQQCTILTETHTVLCLMFANAPRSGLLVPIDFSYY